MGRHDDPTESLPITAGPTDRVRRVNQRRRPVSRRADRRRSSPPPVAAAPAKPRREGERLPLYGRILRLKHLRPGGVLCFLLFEGAIGLAALLALAGLVSWWGLIVLPIAVATMVKLNDIVAGSLPPRRR